MGREVRRVPLDFDWPLEKIWEGYTWPARLKGEPCGDCAGRGTTPAHDWALATAHMMLLLANDLRDQERGRPMHPYFNDYYTSGYGTRPSADIADLTAGLAGREAGFLGHDSLDGWSALRKIVEAAGLDPETWGICAACEGHGETEKYPGQRADQDAWERTDPPEGEGWQLWSTTTEGHPMTPVFATAEELADYCAREAVSWFGHTPAPRDQWLRSFVGDEIAGMVRLGPNAVIL